VKRLRREKGEQLLVHFNVGGRPNLMIEGDSKSLICLSELAAAGAGREGFAVQQIGECVVTVRRMLDRRARAAASRGSTAG
jgi:hypothetical protein